MLKRKTTTTYEYDKDGNVIKTTIVEEVFEEQIPLQQYPFNNPCKQYDTHEFWWKQPYCSCNTTDGPNQNLTTTTTTTN